jgi:hypothetical protein
MWIRLRQIAVVTADLRETALDIQNILGLEACHMDPGVGVFGLKNTLWPIGSQFLECVTPVEENTAGGRYIERRKGDGGYMVINQVDDVEVRIKHVNQLGVRIANDMNYEKSGFHGIQLHPADTGGSFFEMDQMTSDTTDQPGGPWWPAGSYWQPYVRDDRVKAITAAELQSPDPLKLATRWGQIAQTEVWSESDGVYNIAFENATLRFIEDSDGRGEGLGGIDLLCADRDAVLTSAKQRNCYVNDNQLTIAGLRVYLRD